MIKFWGTQFCSQKTLKYEFRPTGIEPTRFVLFEVLGVPRCLRYLSLDHFGQDIHKNLRKTSDTIWQKILVCLIKLVKLRPKIYNKRKLFLFPVGQRWWAIIEPCTAISRDNFQLVQTDISKLDRYKQNNLHFTSSL